MGNLRPIGSEKLEGMDKINRIMEIARYNEHIPQPINEDSSNEYKITLADGFNYQIVKEKNGYVLKKGLNESYDYLEPMKNRKHYSSYSAAFKRLNLIAKEVNINEGQDKNISLFTESEDSEKKYYLKLNTNEQAVPAPAPAPAPAPVPAPAPEAEVPAAPVEPEAEMPPMDDMADEGQDDEIVTFKTIQKLTGKLGQKLRTLNADEENKMTSDDVKYVINSVLSALDLNTLQPEDKEEIMSKFEGGEDMGMEPDMGDEEMGMGPEGEEEEMPVAPEGEMAEGDMGMSMDDISSMFDDEESDDFDYPSQPRQPIHRKIKDRRISDDHAYKMEEMIEGIFSESKIDKILKKYFQIDEAEKREVQNKKPKVVSEEVERKKLVKRVQYVSESETQYLKSKKLITQYPDAKLLGKTKNKNLVFQVNESKIKITPKGEVI
jgi:hypothetical protein